MVTKINVDENYLQQVREIALLFFQRFKEGLLGTISKMELQQFRLSYVDSGASYGCSYRARIVNGYFGRTTKKMQTLI